MKRDELVRQLVLAEIADDYEEPDHIWENVAQRAEMCSLPVERAMIARILLELVDLGLARAYDLSLRGPARELDTAPPLEQIAKYYFWITPQGKDVHLTYRTTVGWPFDDEGDIRSDWVAPH